MIVEKFYDWVNGDFESKDIPPSLALSNILTTWQAFNVKRGFGRKAQANFLTHFLSIRGQSSRRKENPEVLKIMMRLYKESDVIGSTRLYLVAKVLYERDDFNPNETLVISDYYLSPNYNGCDVIEQVQTILGATPTMVVTGETDSERLEEIRKAGHSVFRKPLKPAILRVAIQRILRNI